MLTRETLVERIAELEKRAQQAQANYHAFNGALVLARDLLRVFDEPEPSAPAPSPPPPKSTRGGRPSPPRKT